MTAIDQPERSPAAAVTALPVHHYEPTSHDRFDHDSLSGLAYDWSRVADPATKPKPPFRVYLPQSTADVVTLVTEARDRGDRVVVRSHGHSSNNLVTPEHGTIMITDWMSRILELDEAGRTVRVQSGVPLAVLDMFLAERKLGLKVIGDHTHITAGGFASVGGISPASHRHGMFVDTVASLEYVDWDGAIHRVGRDANRGELDRVLGGLGRFGVITELTIDVMAIDKFGPVYANDRHMSTNAEEFARHSAAKVRDPGDAVAERGVWADFPMPGVPGGALTLGQFSAYHETGQNAVKTAWDKIGFGYQKALGHVAGRLPSALDRAVKGLGLGAVLLSPRFATFKNIERFTDQVLDSTAGDPTRMLVVLGPAEAYERLFHQLYQLCREERRRSDSMTFISIYVKAIRSPWLAAGEGDGHYCELMIYLGLKPANMTQEVLDRLVAGVDEITVSERAFRYMHSLTGTDPQLLEKVDPNFRHSGTVARVEPLRAKRPAAAAGG